MKFLLAPDSFKGSLTAKEAALAMERAIQKILPEAETVILPMADGGEGTVQSLIDATQGQRISERVMNPLMQPVMADYGILGDGKTAIIEMAAASGLQFVDEKSKNPLITTTYGTGQLMKSALDRGIRKIIMGMGGSATNDGGAGMAEALGVRFLDKKGRPITRGGGGLSTLAEIDISGLDPRIADTEIIIASDVTNPLVGEIGASAVFAPQKGANPDMVRQLDDNLRHYADLIKASLGKEIAEKAGAGAAGGLSGGLLAFTDATIEKGIELVIRITGLMEKSKDADYVLTGEGGIDFQTQYGKTPMGVAKAAKKANPETVVIALGGYIGEQIDSLYQKGIDAIFGILPAAIPLDQALLSAAANVERTTENIVRLIKADKAVG
ncbi:glycerate kinase [Zymomonas mobilis subsp. mobilis ZM4 = ATCC 31821]|uniref:Glycerate kinase n=1 Tax=Zymomonas mobilis subsp. mobilis (strain ATCC 31821 / ZM4 / CP4) TaxID=264203 RepID=Q5NRH1_ZYMMO|nr:glycerate kinase [Zymomonas mobilis]AAV88683.1 Glycerate kinase [Zymomonas mobilis subsp. mobilis ZM4 = ATCC 31821]AVZ25095.1 glycerate kinase [Zymomonas mobilis subsp. mobilis]AVZ26986.1 glycerate kinase [Zymomonas mobilis subsp. mobilis]AVZ41432.1 glycerate kinase [Zymomonas mobilis subsp. mobilis ZM4 = ATCC 31821]UBQ07917.1 glycerate kinase [Zymomonas mobilis]